jgi:hypothetical protein
MAAGGCRASMRTGAENQNGDKRAQPPLFAAYRLFFIGLYPSDSHMLIGLFAPETGNYNVAVNPRRSRVGSVTGYVCGGSPVILLQ